MLLQISKIFTSLGIQNLQNLICEYENGKTATILFK